jgi:hypothetical protein
MKWEDFARVPGFDGGNAADISAFMASQGFLQTRRAADALRERRVLDVARLFADVMQGRQDPSMLREAMNPQHLYIVQEIGRCYPSLQLSETMSVTDFAEYLTVDVLDRLLYGYYTLAPIPNRALVKEVTLNDFRTVKRLMVNGGVSRFKKALNPAEPPQQRNLTPVPPITYEPELYQGAMSVNWRALINDDYGMFNDMLQRLAASWNLTLWFAITELYVDANGPHASLYNSTFGNLILQANGASVDNPPLDFQGLIDGLTVLGLKRDVDGNPIVQNGTIYLWYGPALAMTAKALLAATLAQISVGGGTTNSDGFPSQRLSVAPAYVTGNITPVEDKLIPVVCTASGVKNSMWGLTYDPRSQARPSIEFGMLRGFTTPQLFQKAPNTMRVGGGIDPMLGDFLTMDLDYKSISIFGGTPVEGRSTVASKGTGQA